MPVDVESGTAVRRGPTLDALMHDLRFAIRSLRRAPGFASAVIATLALGIGANTAMFTLLRGTLLRPLPNRAGDRLVYLHQSAPGIRQQNVLFSIPEIGDLRSRTRTLAAIADYSSAVPFTLVADDERPTQVPTGVVSGNYFDVMGLRAVAGRLIGPGDGTPASSPVAVISFRFWNEHFAADRRIIGRVVRLNELPTTVIGVVEPAPQYPDAMDVFVNTAASPHHLSAAMNTSRTHRMSEVFARLVPRATPEQAREEIRGIAAGMVRDHPDAYRQSARYEVSVRPLEQVLNARASLTVWLLMGAALLVLVIACANVSNLTLMRSVGRERELIVRAALGAGTARLRHLLIVENLVLALCGGAIGALAAVTGVRFLSVFAAQFSPRAAEIRVDYVVLLLCLATSVAVALALSFIPRLAGDRLAAPTGRRTTMSRARQRFQHSLVVAQVALCMVLLTGAGLLVRTLAALQAIDSGVQVDHVLTMELPIQGDILREIRNQPENLARYDQIRERVAALPGVSVAGLGLKAPLRTTEGDAALHAENREPAPNQPAPRATLRTVDPSYFAAAGIRIVDGRPFATTDQRDTPRVVVLSKSLAARLFGPENPVGRRIALGDPQTGAANADNWQTVVGVVGDTREHGPEAGPTPMLYLPFAQNLIVGATLIVRTKSDPERLQSAIVRTIRETFPRQAVEHVETLEGIRDEGIAPRRLNALFIIVFGGLAFAIAIVGIAAVLAFSVSSRTAEIGIRMSLGADASRVRRMILGEGSALIGAGVAIGVAGGVAAARLMRTLLFAVTAHDPATIGVVAFVLVAVGTAACWVPAARAAAIDPATALRVD